VQLELARGVIMMMPMWIWTTVGILVIVLLVVLIAKLLGK
jgi:hypothetical protein